MKVRDAVKRLKGVIALLRDREDIEPEEIVELMRFGLGIAPALTLSDKRAAAGRKGGQARVAAARERGEEVRPQRPTPTEATPEANPKQPPRQTRSKPEATAEAKPEANPKQNPLSVPPPAPSPLTYPPDIAKDGGANSKDLAGIAHESVATELAPPPEQKTEPRNLSEALDFPIHERARLVERRPTAAGWLTPHEWPEVRKALDVFRDATRQPNLPSSLYERDPGVRAIVALYAAEPIILPSQLHGAIRNVVRSEWFQKERRGPGALSLEVIRRALPDQVDQELVRRAIAAADGERAPARAKPRHTGSDRPEPIGAAFGKVVGAGGETE